MRVLILVHGGVGERMSGPAIRAWSLAQALSEHHEVTAVIDGELPSRVTHPLRVVRATRPRVIFETMRHDVVMAACQPPYALTAARARGAITVADHYDPGDLELGTLDGVERRLRTFRALRRLQHGHADIVLCAGEAQRRILLSELEQIGRGSSRGPSVGIVPFGLSEAPTRTDATPLRDAFPEIEASDKIVLWWGKIWRWFDAETAIRAFAPLSEARSDIKLVITAGPPPDPRTEAFSIERKARQVAEELGLLGRTVFFLEEWLPYEDRHHCLHEADLGLTLHANTPEAEVAARARYMDYAWAGLPCVLAYGDEISAEFGRAGFAELVAPGDTDAVTQAVTRMIDSPELLRDARAAGAELAERYRWTTLAQELRDQIETSARHRVKRDSLALLAARTAAYYTRRAADILHDVATTPGGDQKRDHRRFKYSLRA
jgi:glycosyltransferase involved in cell wall biosynthesis